MYINKLAKRLHGIVFLAGFLPIALTAQINYQRASSGGSFFQNDYTPRAEKFSAAGDTIRSIPAPDTNIMGIEWIRDTLYVLRQAPTSAEYANLYKLDPADGSVLSQFSLPFTGYVLGLTFDGSNLWIVKWSPDQIVYKITTSGSFVFSFLAPSTDPRGMAWDGQYLWLGDAPSQVLYQVDTLGAVMNTVSMSGTIDWSMGMVWVPEHTAGHLWVNEDVYDDINQLDVSGANAILIQDFSHPATLPEGICHDGEHLWVADYHVPRLWQIDDGIEEGIEEAISISPRRFSLLQNYPNPFNHSTSIRYILPYDVFVELTIYNIHGQLVRTLVRAKELAGDHVVKWYGNDGAGRSVANGVYIYQLKMSNGVQETKKLIFSK